MWMLSTLERNEELLQKQGDQYQVPRIPSYWRFVEEAQFHHTWAARGRFVAVLRAG
jgi:hypothetical protein